MNSARHPGCMREQHTGDGSAGVMEGEGGRQRAAAALSALPCPRPAVSQQSFLLGVGNLLIGRKAGRGPPVKVQPRRGRKEKEAPPVTFPAQAAGAERTRRLPAEWAAGSLSSRWVFWRRRDGLGAAALGWDTEAIRASGAG
ncbi:hypothetical protein lerEdw1_020123 [Lerista edwardsae]|nr:hypothetical protein lerEdw1_020123 [Lerista edwardsae]